MIQFSCYMTNKLVLNDTKFRFLTLAVCFFHCRVVGRVSGVQLIECSKSFLVQDNSSVMDICFVGMKIFPDFLFFLSWSQRQPDTLVS